MAEHNGSWYPLTNLGVQWDNKGNPYYLTNDHMRDYIPPIAAAQYHDDPKMVAWANKEGAKIDYSDPNNPKVISTGVPEGGFLHERGTWDSENGGYDQGLNWGSILSLAVGGVIAAPLAIAALGGGAGASAAVNTAVATGSAEQGAAAAGVALTAPVASTVGLDAAGLAALPGLTTVPAVGGAAAGVAGAGATAAGIDASATTGLDAAGAAALPGASSIPTVGDLATVGSSIPNIGEAGNTLADITSAAGGGSKLADILNKVGKISGPAGAAISGLTQSLGDTQFRNAQLDLNANGQNIQGRSAVEQETINRAKEEDAQRKDMLHDVYLDSYAKNPSVSPFNITGGPKYSDTYKNTIASLAKQGSDTLGSPARYNVAGLPEITPYKDYIPTALPANQGGTQQSGAQTAGNTTAAILAGLGLLGKIFT